MVKCFRLFNWMIFFLVTLFAVSEARAGVEQVPISAERPITLSAYTQVWYTTWEEGRDEFRVRRARVILKGNVFKDIDYKLQVEAVKAPILLDAMVSLSLSPYAKFTVGQFKVPFSIENLLSGSDLDTVGRSNTVNLLCPGRPTGAVGRDIGMTFSGKLSYFEYTLGVFNGSGINQGEFNKQKDLAGRLVFSASSKLAIGLSHYIGKYSANRGDPYTERVRTGLDLFFVHDGFSLKGEYIFARDEQTDRYGYYIQGGCYFVREKIEVIAKYDFVDTNFKEQDDRIAVMILGLNYFFSKRTKFQINYLYHFERLTGLPRNVILAQIQAGF